ncbi:hypothetical protein SBOR_1800 [Sclerotinia borealis F-4128]|uniref:Integral membrane protein n=1 Tax=Sclerotinia borealis (strain F-4128) TaxID=1432307 RepID=W9CPN6_SCLBF|nr:hypothetical protein SBOR_1800 [Sclerotinia borealis F-4128]
MAQQGPSQPSPASSTTNNPIVAVGRKVKSVLSTQERPTIRIYRDSSSTPDPRNVPVTRDFSEKPTSTSLPYGSTQQSRTGNSEQSATQAASQPLPSQGNAFTNRFRSLFCRHEHSTEPDSYDHEYDPDMVDLLDVVGMYPEISTLSTLTNVQNSLFVPQMGRIINRQPTYRLSDRPGEVRTIDKIKAKLKSLRSPENRSDDDTWKQPNLEYAVLPDGERLGGWSPAEVEELDDLVRHQLHSRRAKFKRSMKGFGQYVRRRKLTISSIFGTSVDHNFAALGLFITVYTTLITLFGAAWVLFLIGWISLGSQKAYIVNVVDNVLVALFAIIGDGLAPFRAVDTYHMAYIAHYHRKTWKRREKLGLPELWDHNDLPEQRKEEIAPPPQLDLESLCARRMPKSLARRIAPRIPKKYADRMLSRNQTEVEPTYEYTVLTPEEQTILEFHERKFSKSHTFYKLHETETHYAFPLKLLFTVVLLLDLHSCLQITLGACTWGIPYEHRPFALTTVILCCSITCNIMGGVLISMGDKRTRKHEVIEKMMKQELTSEAIESINTRRVTEAEERGEIDPEIRKKREEERNREENEEIKKSWKSVPSLPKKLLGKGEDHRQPSLPVEARSSSSSMHVDSSKRLGAGSGSSGDKMASRSVSATLKSVQENPTVAQPTYPQPAVVKQEGVTPPKKGVGQRVLAGFRKADLDRS